MNRPFRLFALFACAPLLRAATIEGLVRDSSGAVVAGVTVRVTAATDSAVKTVRSDAKGHFSISSLSAAAYTLHVEKNGIGEATVGPLFLTEDEKKTADLVLKPGIEFFDEPKFTVAGVTQSTYAGGHASDAMTRSAEALTKATVSLSKEQQPATSNSTEADQHHRDAVAEETQGDPLEAVREFQRAAELNPSETNLFDWGTELLTHGVPEAASEVFEKGVRLFPGSSRMRLGAAVSSYTQGNYTEGGRLFFEATDLNPVDPNPYLFLGKLENPEITESDAFEKRLARFVELLPQNAWANYYYGVNLLKGRTDPNDTKTLLRAQSFLEKAVELDPKLAQGFLELGIILLDKRDFTGAVQMLNRAVQLDPLLEQAHYRLAQAYRQTGESEKAQAELAIFIKLSTDSSQQLNRERSQLQRFVVTLKSPPAN